MSDDDGVTVLTILYGTETGNAEDVAYRIADVAQRHRVPTRIYNLADYDRTELICESHVIFVVSTTGQGEFPMSVRPLWRFLLRQGLPPDILSDLTFTTFGLGDSTYARYCWASHMLHKRLLDLGASEWFKNGEADDQHELGIDGGVLPWLDTFVQHLRADLCEPSCVPISPDVLMPPRVHVHVSSDMGKPSIPCLDGAHMATVVRNERVTHQDHFQDVRCIDLALDRATAPSYRAGDVVCLVPENKPEDVEALLQRLGWASVADKMLRLTQNDPHRPWPPAIWHDMQQGSLTLRRLLTVHLDPFSVPRRSFFDLIRHFSPSDHREHEKLVEFLQPGEGTDDMYEYAQRVRRTMAEVLAEFKSVKIPPSFAMELFPLMRARQYSLASDPTTYPDTLQLLVAVVKYKTRIQKPREGIASSWLARLEHGTRIPVRIQPGTLLPPAQSSTPIIAIGPGTGMAPLRSLLRERLNTSDAVVGETLVFAGCRYRAKDCLYAAEWEAWAAAPHAHLTWIVAASRDQPHKIYVQDRLREWGARVWDILGPRRGIVYLCGTSGKMPQQVRQAAVDVFCEHGHMSTEQAERYLAKLEAERRWQEECW